MARHLKQVNDLSDRRRSTALKILTAAEKNPRLYIDAHLETGFRSSGLSPEDRRWITELVLGTTRWRKRLDWEIKSIFKGRYQKAQHALRSALRMGLYQMRFMETPAHAAVHATIEVAKAKLPGKTVPLMNAVLRRLGREPSDPASTIEDPVQRLAVKHSHPEWLIERWLENLGTEATEQLCAFNNHAPRMWVRVNTLVNSVSEFLDTCSELEIRAEASGIMDSFLEISELNRLIHSDAYAAGAFWIQDIAAGMVSLLLEPSRGERILDLCSAPGGKALHTAVLAGDKAEVVAADASAERLKRVGENVTRLGLNNVILQHADARTVQMDPADKILLDVPCSGTGVMHRRADSRWNKQPHDIEQLTQLQSEILENAWSLLKSGGLLVYSTCTLEPEENWLLIDSMQSRLSDMRIEPVDNPMLQDYVDAQGALMTLPSQHGLDGMFAVKLRKL